MSAPIGTLVCDLERRRVVALLPDREQATAQTWAKMNGSIRIVARDRGGGYGEAIPFADRWHLMEKAGLGFLDAVRRSMRQSREVVGAATIDPALLTAAERIQYEGCLRWEEAGAAIRALAEAGVPIRRICQRLGHSCTPKHTSASNWSQKARALSRVAAHFTWGRRRGVRRQGLQCAPPTGDNGMERGRGRRSLTCGRVTAELEKEPCWSGRSEMAIDAAMAQADPTLDTIRKRPPTERPSLDTRRRGGSESRPWVF
ncbi:hypothetical protein QO012_004033 [Methylobacterium aerolatum]|uniref:Transposase n=1 Tax=Methylobacterium aerolatum TaxID=418708 RepID=A0ABU0I4H3_9HYPH|nr:hypothetical protein [Methylobacterium aerolatum]GJD33544.1 hypothetical protein FMGBMHLM_0434 [Methylobacterium aerolatum]